MSNSIPRILFILATILFLMSASACGSQNEEPDSINGSILQDPAPIEREYRTISAFLPICLLGNDASTRLRNVERLMNQDMRSRNKPYVLDFELSSFNPSDWNDMEMQLTRLNTQFMAGHSYDIIALHPLFPIQSWMRSGFLANMYTLMDNCYLFGREDYFENVLAAFEFNEGLYVLPVGFGFEYVGINARMPERFIHQFMAYDTISFQNIIDIYYELMMSEYSSTVEHFALRQTGSRLFDIEFLINMEIANYVDFYNRDSLLMDGGFESFLTSIKRISAFGTSPKLSRVAMFGSETVRTATRILPRFYDELAFLFEGKNGTIPIHVFFDAVSPSFLNFIPVSDGNGNLVIDHFNLNYNTMTFSISNNRNSALAWEAVQHLSTLLMTTPGSHGLVNTLSIPVRRYNAHYAVMNTFETLINHNGSTMERFYGICLDSTMCDCCTQGDTCLCESVKAETIQTAVYEILRLAEMPMVIANSYIPSSLYADFIDSYMRGIISAPEAVRNIHNRIALWLIE